MILYDVKIQQLDVPNKNNRMYNAKAFDSSIESVNKGNRILWGQVGLPNDITKIDLGKISHKVVDLRIEDGYLVGTIKILNNPQGEMLKTLVESDALLVEKSIAFRPAGIGTFVNIDGVNVVTDYSLLSIDLVNDPA